MLTVASREPSTGKMPDSQGRRKVTLGESPARVGEARLIGSRGGKSNRVRQQAEGLPVSSCFLQMMSDLKNPSQPGQVGEVRD